MSRARAWIGRLCAAAALGLAAATYGRALLAGAWPPGHPWNGLALLALSGLFVLQSRPPSTSRVVATLYFLLPMMAAGCALLWLQAIRPA